MKLISGLGVFLGIFFVAQHILGSDAAKKKPKGPKVTAQVHLQHENCHYQHYWVTKAESDFKHLKKTFDSSSIKSQRTIGNAPKIWTDPI